MAVIVPRAAKGYQAGRGLTSNTGGSFGQFIFAPVAQAITSASGWVVAVQSLAFTVLLARASGCARRVLGAVRARGPAVR